VVSSSQRGGFFPRGYERSCRMVFRAKISVCNAYRLRKT